MSTAPSSLITPDERQTAAQLQLLAKNVVEGLAAGKHRSPHKGASVEFKEHRQYTKGDEIRSIDWKQYGKTDRLFIRQYEDETSLRAMILLDQSGSMGYCGQRSNGVSKHLFAVQLAACIATLIVAQQDGVGLATFDKDIDQLLPPRSQPSHLKTLFQILADSKVGRETQLSKALQATTKGLRRRGILFLLSDCFDDPDALIKALRYYRHTGSEVIVFQIWDDDELDFPFTKRTEFRDLEKLSRLEKVDPAALRTAYLKKLQEFRDAFASSCIGERIDLIECSTSQNHAEILRQYIASRTTRSGRLGR